MSDPKVKASAFEKLIMISLICFGLHWFVSGWWANLIFKECRTDGFKNELICDCKKSAFRKSPYFEFFIYAALTENKQMSRDIAKGMYNAMYHCR